MSDKRITIRAAEAADADVIANVVAMAIGDEGAVSYCGEDYLAVLRAVAEARDTQYSWQQSLVAEVDGQTAGAVVGYDGADFKRLREETSTILDRLIGRPRSIVDETEAGEYYLDSVGVLPAFRGQGVGRALVEAFAHRAFDQGYERVGLIVDFENPEAERLYSSIGFRRVGRRLFYGHNMWHLQLENPNTKRDTVGQVNITILGVDKRQPPLIEELTRLWEASVRSSHDFLSEDDISEIRGYVPGALMGVTHLMVAYNGAMQPVAFMGVDEHRIEMLFVDPHSQGGGVGRKLVEFGIARYGIESVTVNEQNPRAIGFYEHLGFKTFKRTDEDEQGRPFPLLYMKL